MMVENHAELSWETKGVLGKKKKKKGSKLKQAGL